MNKLTLFCLLAAFLGCALADMCLSYPGVVSPGGGCGGPLQCDQFHFCNEEGVCERKVKEGEDCKDKVCEDNLSCKGPSEHKRCYAPVHPGQDCTDSSSQSGPYCGTGYCSSNRCLGGSIGDACYEDDDCVGGLTCTDRVCTGLGIGSACEDTDDCVIGAYCHPNTEVCTALPTSGNCTQSNTCAYGYVCSFTSADAPYRSCIPSKSLPAASYCQTGGVCQSSRCYNNYCAEESPKYCEEGNDCANNELCTCNGGQKILGFGNCKAWKCNKAEAAYLDCYYAHCRSSSYFNGSCVERNCGKERMRYDICSPASTLLVPLFSVSLFALLASFFARHF